MKAIDKNQVSIAVAPVKAEADIAIKEAQVSAANLAAWADAVVIDSETVSDQAGEVLKYCHDQIKALDEQRKTVVKPLNEVVSTITTWFKPAITSFEAAKNTLKAKIGAWVIAQEEAKRKALEEHDFSKAMLIPSLDKPSNAVSMKQVVKWRIVNEEEIPIQYWIVNSALIDQIVARQGVACEIPGIEVFTEQVPQMARGKRS